MQSEIDLVCGSRWFVEVKLDESLQTAEARELIAQTLFDRDIGRLTPTTHGFRYYLPIEQWDEDRIVARLHTLLQELFGNDHTICYIGSNGWVTRAPNGVEHLNDPTRS